MKFFFVPLLCLAATSVSALTIPVNDTLVEDSGLEKRNPVLALGLFIEILGAGASRTRGRLSKLETDRGRPYDESSGNCIMRISTQGGGHCKAQTTPGERADVGTDTTKHDDNWNVCWWDDDKRISGKQYFTDKGIGKYSIVFTSRDGDKVNKDIEGAEGCEAEGMCNPQVTFYRDGYNIILNTWQSMFADSMSSDGPGLCKGGVKDQFHKGGVVFEYTCAVPCENEEGLPFDGRITD